MLLKFKLNFLKRSRAQMALALLLIERADILEKKMSASAELFGNASAGFRGRSSSLNLNINLNCLMKMCYTSLKLEINFNIFK